ncbi:MAG TPA: hypothetical protein VEC12_14020 [Bacteroidia bacterium]|nr:hypothetical protein [Bacteroidia bacterium]
MILVNRLWLVIAALVFTGIAGAGCKPGITDYDREKAYLDTLAAQNRALQVALNVDEEELKKRMAIIDTWYIKLNDTVYEVAQKMQVDFNGFKVVYKKYIDNFFIYSAAADQLDEQYKTLEEKVKKQSLTREEFKQQYAVLKQGFGRNLDSAVAIAKPVYDIEFSWNRYQKTMEAMGGRPR